MINGWYTFIPIQTSVKYTNSKNLFLLSKHFVHNLNRGYLAITFISSVLASVRLHF